MAERYHLLLGEVDRVVHSPYPTQLKASSQTALSRSLRDILYSKCSESEIARVVQARLCQLDRLANCLLEGLQQWPYVLDIITKLSYHVAVRDALLENEPNLLHNILEQATRTDNVRSKYTKAAVAIVSHPLPGNCALPASAQTLFLKLVEHAACNPSAASVKPLHSFLGGTTSLLLGLLSNNMISRLEEQLDAILRSNHNRSSHDAGDQLLTLHCLAIMQCITSAVDESSTFVNSFYQTQDLLQSTQAGSPLWTPAEMQKYFTGSVKALKTIQLMVLQAMWACQANSESLDDRVDTLMLANDILGAIPTDIRDTWCQANGAIVQKLQQKALACDGRAALRMYAFGFVCQLCKPVYLQCSVVEAVRNAIRGFETLCQTPNSESDGILWHCMSAVMDRGTTLCLLQTLATRLANASDVVESSGAYTEALRQLATLSQEKHEVCDAAIEALSLPTFQSQLRELVGITSETTKKFTGLGGEPSVCVGVWRNALNKVVHELSTFLLQCALQAQATEYNVSSFAGNLLLELHAASARSAPPCAHMRSSAKPAQTTMAFAEKESTQFDVPADWRQALQAHLTSEAQCNQGTIGRIFAQACRSLEERCESVEQPLREEQAARHTLQEQYDQLQQAYSELEAQNMDRKLHYDSLEAENEGRVRELTAAREKGAELERRTNELESTLNSVRQEAERGLTDAQETRQAQELQHATAIAKREEDLDDLRERFASIDRYQHESNEQIEKLSNILEQTESSKASLQAQVDRLEQGLRDKCATIRDQEHAMSRTMEKLMVAEAELQSFKDELSREKQCNEQNVHQIKEHMRQNTEAANASHNEAMDRVAVQHGEEIANIEGRLSNAEQEVKRLQRKCNQKDQQIAEANAMRSNLLAALGGPPAQTGLPHRTRSSTRTQLQPSQLDPSPPTPSSAMAVESQFDGRASFASNASSTNSRNGPTPKRAKPRKSFKVASPAKPRTSMGTKTGRASMIARGTSTAKRRPLGSLSINTSPMKDGPKTPSNGKGRSGSEDFDDSTFDESELFGNVPGTRPRDLGSMLEEDTEN